MKTMLESTTKGFDILFSEDDEDLDKLFAED